MIDIYAQSPADIQLILDAMGDGIGHYVFISTVATYASGEVAPIDKNHPLAHDAPPDSYSKVKIPARNY